MTKLILTAKCPLCNALMQKTFLDGIKEAEITIDIESFSAEEFKCEKCKNSYYVDKILLTWK